MQELSKKQDEQLTKTTIRPESRFYIIGVLIAVFFFLAANSGSGWIYLINAFLLCSLVLSIVMPLLELKSIAVVQTLHNVAIAGQNVIVNITVKCVGNIGLPTYWLRLKYSFKHAQENAMEDDPVLLPYIDKEETSFTLSTDKLRRGVHRLGSIELSTSFPFGFVWVSRKIQPSEIETITVYPKTVNIAGNFLHELRSMGHGSSALVMANRSSRSSTYIRGLRDYAVGDSPRLVHWATSARLGKLFVKEFEADGLPFFDLHLDLSANWQSQAQFDLAVTTCASLLSFGHKQGFAPVLFIYPDLLLLKEKEELFSKADSPLPATRLDAQLDALARVNPVSRGSYSAIKTFSASSPDRTLVVILPEGETVIRHQAMHLVHIASGDMETSKTRALISKEEDIRTL